MILDVYFHAWKEWTEYHYYGYAIWIHHTGMHCQILVDKLKSQEDEEKEEKAK